MTMAPGQASETQLACAAGATGRVTRQAGSCDPFTANLTSAWRAIPGG